MAEERQTQSMIDFIEREAREKAEELEQAAQEEYDVEKMRLVESEKARIRAEMERNRKQVEIDRRVMHTNKSKMEKMRIREQQGLILEQLKERICERLITLRNDQAKYRDLMLSILSQSLQELSADCVAQCCHEDVELLKSIIPDAEKCYSERNAQATPVHVKIGNEFLSSKKEIGGVYLTTTDGRISCNNTLAARLDNCFNYQLPLIKYELMNPNAQEI